MFFMKCEEFIKENRGWTRISCLIGHVTQNFKVFKSTSIEINITVSRKSKYELEGVKYLELEVFRAINDRTNYVVRCISSNIISFDKSYL